MEMTGCKVNWYFRELFSILLTALNQRKPTTVSDEGYKRLLFFNFNGASWPTGRQSNGHKFSRLISRDSVCLKANTTPLWSFCTNIATI